MIMISSSVAEEHMAAHGAGQAEALDCADNKLMVGYGPAREG